VSSVLLGLVAALSWGVNDFLARFPSRAVGPLQTVLVVTFAGLLFLTVWLLISGDSIRISWPQIWLPAASGVFFTLSTLSLFAAFAIGPISLVAPIAGSYPAVAMIFAVAQGARPSPLQWLAIAAVLAGVMLVSRSGETYEQSGYLPPGKLKTIVGLALCASLGSAVSQTSGQAAAVDLGEITAVWLARIFGLITIAAIYLMRRPRGTLPSRWLPLLGLMGGLDAGALAPAFLPPATCPTQPLP
jgi:drug/metabolite transporter (DMT)-like permease